MRTEPLELPLEEDEELERDGVERAPDEMRGEDRETEGEVERRLLDGEPDLGAEKTDRDEEPEKERNRGALLLRDGAEGENDLEAGRAEEPRLPKLGVLPWSLLSPEGETRPVLRE